MSRTGWKQAERTAARLVGGQRCPANTGGPVDVIHEGWVMQVKNVRRLSLTEIGRLAVEIERIGFQATPAKLGLLVLKQSAGQGRQTPRLVVMTEAVFQEMNGRLPRGVA